MSAPMLEGLIAHLKANAAVAALVSTRVYGLEIPRTPAGALAVTMPGKIIVLRMSGGPPKTGTVRERKTRIDSWSYGETQLVAAQVDRAVYDAMELIATTEKTGSYGGVLLRSAEPSAGPMYLKDPEGPWPVVVQSFLVLASEVATA